MNDLIPKKKESLRAIRFRSVPEIRQAVDRSIRTINRKGSTNSFHIAWQRVQHNADDYFQEE